MSSLIEQAAQRLEQLRQAGIEIPEVDADLRPDLVPPAAQVRPPTVPAQPLWSAPVTEPAEPAVQSRRVELDLALLASKGLVTPGAARSHMADQYRVIKRPLIANAMGRGAATVAHGNLIMVTSALPGEGKSFTSINLATGTVAVGAEFIWAP